MASASTPESGRSVRTWLVLAAAAALGLWLLFFDSHSILRRVSWHREHAALQAQNAELVQRIEALEVRLEAAGSDDVVEKIAREQYGMRRPGERVYRVAPAGDHEPK